MDIRISIDVETSVTALYENWGVTIRRWNEVKKKK